MHPVGAGGGPNSEDFSLTWMLASRFEDTIAMARLILSGLTLRYPDIRFIIPHLGGTLALFLQRMDNVAERDGWREKAQPRTHAQRPGAPLLVRHRQRAALGAALRVRDIRCGPTSCSAPTGRCCRPRSSSTSWTTFPEALHAEDARRILDVNAARLLGLGSTD